MAHPPSGYFRQQLSWLSGLAASGLVLRTLQVLFLLLLPNLVQAKLDFDISGIEGELKENVKLHLSQMENLNDTDDDNLRRDLQRLVTEAMQPFGYYQPTLSAQVNANKVSILVQPGPAVSWGRIQIEVPTETAGLRQITRDMLATPPFEPGNIIRHPVYDDYKKQLLLSVRQQGYLDANWQKSQLQIDLDRHLAHVVLIMDPGPRYRIEDVKVTGSKLSDRTINALLKSPVGEFYSAEKIGTLYEDLLSTGYFSNAIIDVEKSPPDQATLLIDLEEQPKDQFTTGVGYGTDTGVRGKLTWTRSRVNNRGDDIYSNMQISQIGEEIGFQYRIPWHHPLERYLSLDTGWKREETTDRESALLTTGIALKRSLTKQWQSSVGINLESENYRQGGNEAESITYLLPNYHYLARVNLNDPMDHASILKYWFDTALGFNVLADDTLFLSAEIGASWTVDLNDTHSFASRFALGGIMTNDFYTVPLSKRFYTGGDQTVRGYRYNSLAPEDENGELIGGQFLNVFSLEYRYALNQEWRLAVFADTGRTYISSHDPFHSGAGFGLRWMLTIGEISFDIAKPVTGEDKSSPRVHVYMGVIL